MVIHATHIYTLSRRISDCPMDEKISRRKYIKSSGFIASLGMGLKQGRGKATSGSYDIDGNDKVRLAKIKSGDDVIEWFVVPKPWKEHLDNMNEIVANFNDEYAGHPGINETGLEPSEQSHDGRSGFRIFVGIENKDVISDLPEKYEGQPIHTELANKSVPQACYNDSNYDNMPGGVAISSNSIEACATSCTRVYYDAQLCTLGG